MNEKTKKSRTIYTPQQVCYLEEKFADQDFPNKIERKKIADILQLSENHVQIWFQNKRAKQKRKQKRRKSYEQKVLVPKPPSFWPQNLSFNSAFEVIHHSEMGQETSFQECEDDALRDILKTKKKSIGSAPSIKVNALATATPTIPTQKEVNSNKSSLITSPCNLVTEATQAHRCSTTEMSMAGEHHKKPLQHGHPHVQLKTQNTARENGSKGNITLVHEKCPCDHLLECVSNNNYSTESTSIYQDESQFISNPLLLLANCATQLHSMETKTLLVSNNSSCSDSENLTA